MSFADISKPTKLLVMAMHPIAVEICERHGDKRGKVRAPPKSLGFILWGS